MAEGVLDHIGYLTEVTDQKDTDVYEIEQTDNDGKHLSRKETRKQLKESMAGDGAVPDMVDDKIGDHNNAPNAHQDIRAAIDQTVSTGIGYHDENADAHPAIRQQIEDTATDTLADAKEYTDEQIRDAEEFAGTFIGVSFQTKADLDAYTIPDRVGAGDFTFVRTDETQGGTTTRYICELDPDTQEKVWDYAYELNQNFSTSQMNAINSGITNTLLSQINAGISANKGAIAAEATARAQADTATLQTAEGYVSSHDEDPNAHSDLLADYAKKIQMPAWTEFQSPGASGAYPGRYSGPYFTGRYWPGGKRIMRVEAVLDGYKPSTTAMIIHEGVTPQIPGIAQYNIVNIGASIRAQDTSVQPYHTPLNIAGNGPALPGRFQVMFAYNAFQLYSVNSGLTADSYQVIMWAEWFEN